MKAEEIMRALHLTAMGRVNTPEQQQLCELLELMAERVLGAAARDQNLAANRVAADAAYLERVKAEAIGGSAVLPAGSETPVKRGPGRPKKAE